MKILFRKTAAISLGIFLALSATLAAAAEHSVAILPFEAPDSRGRNSTRAADLSALVQAQLETDDSRIWVDRQRLDDALAELALSRSGLSTADAIRAGGWIGADLLVRGLIRTDNSEKPAIDLEIIQPSKAQSLAQTTLPFSAPPIARRLQWNPEDAQRITESIRQLLREADTRLARQAAQKTVVPLFFQNTGPHSRLSFLERDLQQAIRETAEKTESGFHVLRFPATREAVGEAELALLGLTENPEVRDNLADIYIWGTFRETGDGQTGTAFDAVPVEVTLSAWNGIDAPDSIRFESTVGDRQNLVRQVAQAVAAAAGQTKPSEFVTAVREPVAATLQQRADEVAAEIRQRGGSAFARSEAGRNLYRYRLKLLATARFLHPASLEIHQQHLDAAWAKNNPLEPLATSLGHWNRIAALGEFARRNPNNDDARFRQMGAILEAAQALARHGRLGLDAEEAYLQSRMLSEILREEALAFFQANADRPDAKIRAAADWFRALYIQETWRDAEIVFNLTEDFWPHFREHYLQWRDKATDHEFAAATSQIRGAYARFGIEAQAIAKLTEPAPARPRAASPAEAAAAPATPPPPAATETENAKTKTAGTAADSGNSVSFREIVFWPQTFYRRQNPESLRLETEPLHDISLLTFADGRLWIGETARRPLAVRDWRNPAGNHYLWSYDPATRTTENLSRKLAPHTAPAAVLPHDGDLWIGFAHDGLYQFSESNGTLRKWTGEDGLLTTSVHALAAVGDELLIAGGSGNPALNRLQPGETVLRDLSVPAQVSRPQSFSAQHRPPPAPLGELRSVAEFNGWLAVTGRYPAIGNPQTNEWEMLTGGPDWSQLPQPPIQIETAPDRFRQPGQEQVVFPPTVEADGDGFWFVSEHSLSFVNPETGEKAGTMLPGIRAAAHQKDFLWLAVQESASGTGEKTKNRLLLFDKRNRSWVTSIPFEADAAVTALAAGPDRLWIGAGRLHELNTSVWTGEIETVTVSSSFPLHLAARSGDLAEVRKLLNEGADPNKTTPNGWTPLLSAVDGGATEIVRELLEAGADPNALSRAHEFPLRLAAEHGNAKIVRLLLDHGAAIDFQGGEPPFRFWEEEISRANLLRDSARVAEIRRARASAETPDRRVAIAHGSWPTPVLPTNESALIAAARTGKAEVVQLLLQAGAHPDANDLYGDTALMHALRNGQNPVADLLADAGADTALGNLSGETPALLAQETGTTFERSSRPSLGIPEVVPYETPLMRAAAAGRIDEIQRLLQSGQNPNALEAGGATAVSKAIFNRQTAAALYLLDHGFQPLAEYIDPNRAPSRSEWQERIRQSPPQLREAQLNLGYEGWLRERRAQRLVGETALFEATRGGNVSVLAKLLDLGMSPDTDAASVTPLMEASARGHLETVALLIDRGANPALRRSDGQTALQLAASDEIRHLLSGGGEIEARPLPASLGPPLYVGIPPAEPVSRDLSPLDRELFAAAASGAEVKVKELLSRGAFPDARDEKLWTPLFHAAQGGHLRTVEILLEAGATLNAVTEQGSSPLVFAILSENTALVERLLELGANPNLYRHRNGTPLQLATLRSPESLELLLQYGALPGLLSPMRDLTYDAPLSAAARTRNLEIAERLLSAGAPVDGNYALYRSPTTDNPAKLFTGPTPFLWAAFADSVEIMQLLLRHGTDSTHQDHAGCTALCYAARGNAIQATRLLLDLGLSDEHALEVAKEKGHAQIIRLLER